MGLQVKVKALLCYIIIQYLSLSSGSLTASLSYDRASHTLTCVSSGGPVNTVTWRRNGAVISSSPYQLGQSLVDGMTSTYHNLLTVTGGDVEDYIGSFSCTVNNSRGSAPQQSLRINGKHLFYSFNLTSGTIQVL